MVLMGGGSLLIAAACVTLVRDVGDSVLPEGAVIDADEHEGLGVQESVQPVPSSGLMDETGDRPS
jgi:hypothetical protein